MALSSPLPCIVLLLIALLLEFVVVIIIAVAFIVYMRFFFISLGCVSFAVVSFSGGGEVGKEQLVAHSFLRILYIYYSVYTIMENVY